jgi:VanZ family protein
MNSFLNQLCRYHIPSALCAGAILLACVIKLPPDENPITIPYFDKIVHFTMFFSFSFLFILENRITGDKKWKEPLPLILLTLLLTAIFGGLIEIIQGEMTDYRSADIYDWYSDLAGSLTAVLLSGILIAIRRLLGKK